MSEDSNRQWTHGIDRTLQRNLRLFPFLFLDYAKWDNIRLTIRATGHKTPGESPVNITVSSYDTTYLQENPQRLG